MALKTNYVDDVLDTSVNTKRKYSMINNADGTVSFEDKTNYTQIGDSFGASEVNGIINRIVRVENVTVPTSAWSNSADGTLFPYVATITFADISADHVPHVYFSKEDSVSGLFASCASSSNGSVQIYAIDVPSGAITIPAIVGIKNL